MNNIEKWKKILISLPEQIFFDIIRNYLGELKTPFNKHTLMDELAHFLRSEKTIERVFSLIDQNDAAVLTAVYMLGPVTPKKLYNFFSEKKSYYDFYLHLQNLEERMLLCNEKNRDGEAVLVFSPIYEDILEEKLIDSSLLLPAVIEKGSLPREKNQTWLDDSLLVSILSFLLRQGQMLKLDGNFRKKVTRELKTVFPDQLIEEADLKIDIIRIVLRRLELVRQEGDYFRPAVDRWKELAELTIEERWLLIIGAVFSKDYKTMGPAVISLIKNIENSGRGYSFKSLSKLAELFFIKNSLEIPENMEDFLQKLADINLILKHEDFYYPNNWLSQLNSDILNKNYDNKSFVIQPNFDIHVSKNIPFKSGIVLAVTADVRKYSDVMHFTLSRESYIRALENSFKCDEIEEFFRSCAGYTLPQNILFSIKSWEKDYLGIAFHSGIVITADEKKRNIIDKSGHFSSHLCKKLSEGVYLVNPKNIDPLLDAFSRAGIENIPSSALVNLKAVSNNGIGEVKESESLKNSSSLIEDFEHLKLKFLNTRPDLPEFIKYDYNEIMVQLEKSSFSSEQKEVISDRIERKIILFPSQITRGISRYEKTEAKGLDYNGKIRIAEQITCEKGYLAEIMETNQNGELLKRLIKPDSLEKEDNTYYLKGFLLPDESEVRICISKISLIRKIKTSLFMK